MTKNDIAAPPIRLGFLLVEGFALMSYASVVEPFRAANTLAGVPLYSWTHISVDGRPVRASNGASILAEGGIGGSGAFDVLFVIAGGDPSAFRDARTFAWLRRLAKANVRLAGVSGGPFILARAGVLDGYRCTIHWDHRAAFEEAFPALALEQGLYVIDRRRMTCAGGIAGLDLAVDLIEREQGHQLAVQVSDWFIRTDPRPAGRAQRMSLRERYGVGDDRLLKVLAHMEAHVEEPSSAAALARIAGVSVRQLERLFAAHLGTALSESYLRIRLEQADALLRKTGLSVTAVGMACGFVSASHFARRYKARYGLSPKARSHGEGKDRLAHAARRRRR